MPPSRSSFARHLIVVCMVALAVATLLVGCIGANCNPQEVRGIQGNCAGGARGYMWTGTGCIYTVACNCTGQDCQRLYATQDGCETAHIACRR